MYSTQLNLAPWEHTQLKLAEDHHYKKPHDYEANS